MKKSICTLFLLMALTLTSLTFPSCSKLKYSSSEKKLNSAVTEIQDAEKQLDKFKDINFTYNYAVETYINKIKYEMGIKNIFKLSGRGTDDFKANRYHFFHGQGGDDSETFSYIDGNTYVELFNTVFTQKMDEKAFGEYCNKGNFAVDTNYFDASHFSEIARGKDKSNGYKMISMRGDNGKSADVVIDFLGLRFTDYVYQVKDIVVNYTFAPDGYIHSVNSTFIVEYSTENDPTIITYNGNFSFLIDSFDSVASAPYIPEDVQKVDNLLLINNFSNKAYEVLASFTTLDATYHKYIKNSDSAKNEYILDNFVHFTEAYRDKFFYYGSMDKRYIKTPKFEDTIQNGMFLDKNGYHTRTTNDEGKEQTNAKKPYSDMEFIGMVFQTLSGEQSPGKDMQKLRFKETEDNYIYTFSFTEEAVKYYGEFLLSSFTTTKPDFSLKDAIAYCEKNESVITVRKSDGCVISHTLKFDVIFNGALRLESNFEMVVNATGDDVELLELSDWNITK